MQTTQGQADEAGSETGAQGSGPQSGASNSGAGPGHSAMTTGAGLDTGVSTSTGMAAVPMYGACEGRGEGNCDAGLLCTIIALGGGSTSHICTAECGNVAQDCAAPPVGWDAVCAGFLHDPPDPFCAIGCTERSGCPDGMTCGVQPPFSPPYYCVP